MSYQPRPMKDVLASVGKGTGAHVRRTPQEEVDAARVRAAGKPAVPHNPELQAWAANEMIDRVNRTVIGAYGNQGRYPMHTLSHGQFAQFKETGQWEGMPTPEEYGPQSDVPEDKEWTPIGEA